jgi:type VI secretion system protein ImpB
MASTSSQKFIGRNRPPRVQIEYDVEVYGSEKKIQLPFIVGVMADLSGKPAEPLPPIDERKFLEIDIDNFDERMKATKPRVAFQVPNTLTGQGNLAVDLTFEKMEEFSPAQVAKNVEPLGKLLTARQQLAKLIAYMDGKSGAEDVLQKLLADPALLQAVANTPKVAASDEAASGSAAST